MNPPSSRSASIATALVTGGTGFIGSHTVELLLHRQFSVRCLVRDARPTLGWLEGLPVTIVRGNLSDARTLEPILRDVDYVIHIAGVTKAKKRSEFVDGNVVTTRNLLQAAAENPRLKKFCYISSLTAVGPSSDGTPVDENAPCRPITLYGESKLEAERLCRAMADRIPVVIIRPPAVYGPRDRDILEMFRWVTRGILPVFGSTRKQISLIYGPELARAIVDATTAERTAGETYFAADPHPYSYLDLVQRLATMMRKRSFRLFVPPFALYPIAGLVEAVSFFGPNPAVLNIEKARDLLQPYWICSAKKIGEHIGFRSRTSIQEGLEATLRWYREHHWL